MVHAAEELSECSRSGYEDSVYNIIIYYSNVLTVLQCINNTKHCPLNLDISLYTKFRILNSAFLI